MSLPWGGRTTRGAHPQTSRDKCMFVSSGAVCIHFLIIADAGRATITLAITVTARHGTEPTSFSLILPTRASCDFAKTYCAFRYVWVGGSRYAPLVVSSERTTMDKGRTDGRIDQTTTGERTKRRRTTDDGQIARRPYQFHSSRK